MTESEAIKICNTIGFATSFSSPQGMPLNTTKDELAEAMRIAIQALEKQASKKPRKNRFVQRYVNKSICLCMSYLWKCMFRKIHERTAEYNVLLELWPKIRLE